MMSENLTVHVLSNGEALCGFYQGEAPREWPEGHVWTGVEDLKNVTCPTCRQKAEELRIPASS
jgi:hypothetical protein